MLELLKEFKKEFQHACPRQDAQYRGKELGKGSKESRQMASARASIKNVVTGTNTAT
jgi:hypothetical protein